MYDAKNSALVQIHHHIDAAGDKPLGPDALAEAAMNCGVEYPTENLAVAHPDPHLELTDDLWPTVVDGKIRLVNFADVEQPEYPHG